MFKKAVLLLCIFAVLCSSAVFAAPDVLYSNSTGNSNNLIVITNPPTDKSATFDMSYIISGYGRQGASVTIYFYDNGIFRIRQNGTSERALQIMGLNGSGTPVLLKPSASNFITPLYNVNMSKIDRVSEKDISSYTINPVDYIIIPEEFSARPEYQDKPIKENSVIETKEESIQIYGQIEEETIKDPDFKSVKPENVSRKYIDNIEIEER